MISYPSFCRLRQLHDQDGLDISQIATELGLHRQTVATWIERAVGYVKRNFLAGRELGSLDAINAAARLWMDTIANARQHGETGKAPDVLFTEERLRPVNPNAFDVATLHSVSAGRCFRVRFDSNTHSVPAQFGSSLFSVEQTCGW